MLRLRAASRPNLAERERNARVSGASGGRIGGTVANFAMLRSRDALASRRGDARKVYQRWLISSRVGGGEMQAKRKLLDEFAGAESRSRVFKHNKTRRSRLWAVYQQTSHKTIAPAQGKVVPRFCTVLFLFFFAFIPFEGDFSFLHWRRL